MKPHICLGRKLIVSLYTEDMAMLNLLALRGRKAVVVCKPPTHHLAASQSASFVGQVETEFLGSLFLAPSG